MTLPLHPASDYGDDAHGWVRDQVCHPQEEARWTCSDCGGWGCPMCEGAGVLSRGTSRHGDRYTPDDPRGNWMRTTPAQRDSYDGYHREVCER